MWIEICWTHQQRWRCTGHPPCEDVDWNLDSESERIGEVSHPPCEDVDWNDAVTIVKSKKYRSSSVRGCGLKYAIKNSQYQRSGRYPPCEDVDWNFPYIVHEFTEFSSSSVRGCGLKSFGRDKMHRWHQSSSVRGCGLKYGSVWWWCLWGHVILRARMWIEIVIGWP